MQAFITHGPVLADSMFSEIRGQARTYLLSLDEIHQIVGTDRMGLTWQSC